VNEVEWRPIPSWEGFYEVSNLGEVRSLPRITTANQRLQGKVLAPNEMKSGYILVGMYRGSQRTADTVHRLVMLAFEGPCPNGYEVCHRNGKRYDNRWTNLYYGTRSENNLDKRLHGTDHNGSKTHCIRGHAFDADNTYWRTEGGRRCRRCQSIRYAQRKSRAAA
jgi:hypothetical protein